jgi:hypothetical protein
MHHRRGHQQMTILFAVHFMFLFIMLIGRDDIVPQGECRICRLKLVSDESDRLFVSIAPGRPGSGADLS